MDRLLELKCIFANYAVQKQPFHATTHHGLYLKVVVGDVVNSPISLEHTAGHLALIRAIFWTLLTMFGWKFGQCDNRDGYIPTLVRA